MGVTKSTQLISKPNMELNVFWTIEIENQVGVFNVLYTCIIRGIKIHSKHHEVSNVWYTVNAKQCYATLLQAKKYPVYTCEHW